MEELTEFRQAFIKIETIDKCKNHCHVFKKLEKCHVLKINEQND